MRISTSMRWLVVAVSAAMLLAVAAACSSETVEVPGETVVVEKEVVKTVEVPGETVVVEKEVVKTVEVPGETVVVKEEVVKEVMVPGETVVVEKEVVKTVEVPGETVTVEVVKEVQVPGETVVVEKEVIKEVEVPGETIVVEKLVTETVEVEKVKVVEVPKGYVTDPVFGSVVSAPEYGGTITSVLKHNPSPTDTYIGSAAAYITSGVVEKVAMVDWAIDRDEYPFIGGYQAPAYALIGALAESWDVSRDGLTYTLEMRQGVNWHDKAPMNGRELIAKDVEHSYHRYLGLGSGFTEPSPQAGALRALPWDSITATDDSTVVMKLKEPKLGALSTILDWHGMFIQPPEVIEEHGDMSDWRHVVGTGPYMLTEVVPESSVTWEKNPDYWGSDEKYPENRLPYIDVHKGVVIPETPTILAGLRSGKLDFIGMPGASGLNAIDQAMSLQKTNPELVLYKWAQRSNGVFQFNMSKPPFDDIRVRQAMQMALDIETINKSYFLGQAEIIPRGRVARQFKQYLTPFEEWPEEIRQYHTYDVERAGKLLDEAGYPAGDDGIRFKSEVMHYLRYDLPYTELAAAYWRAIGVDVEVWAGPVAEYGARRGAGDFAMRRTNSGVKADPLGQMGAVYSAGNPDHVVANAEYDALYEAFQAATTVEEQTRLVKEMDMVFIREFMYLWGPLAPQFSVTQPWVKGYNAEGAFGAAQNQVVFSRLWIDSALKTASGH